jgi:hypothetical protein
MPRLKRARGPIVPQAARARVLTVQAAHRAARARIELAIVVPLIAGVLLANEYREQVFGLDVPVRVFTAIALSSSAGASRAMSGGRSRRRSSAAWSPGRRGRSAS